MAALEAERYLAERDAALAQAGGSKSRPITPILPKVGCGKRGRRNTGAGARSHHREVGYVCIGGIFQG
jgi:hypothetical protein